MSGEEVIEIEYQLTVDDYAKFSADLQVFTVEHKKSNAVFIRIYVFTLLFCLIVDAINAYAEYLEGVDFDIFKYVFTSLFVFILFTYLLYFFVSKKKKHYMYSSALKSMMEEGDNKALLSPHKITLSERAIFQKSDFVQSEYRWGGIEKVQMLDGSLCLFISAISALYIPSRYFKSEEEKQRVYAQCVAWFEAAREKAA